MVRPRIFAHESTGEYRVIMKQYLDVE